MKKKKYLVYTSAGDQANIASWVAGDPQFDLIISYYGDTVGRHAELASYYEARKGGKFPNLYHLWNENPGLFDLYDAIMVMDDDIQISTEGINRVFDLRSKYSLWCCQPAFSTKGRISHRITQHEPYNILRYTNFVEVTCPVFHHAVLRNFLSEYDPSLVGWGVDWWFLYFMKNIAGSLEGRVAVIDDVVCLNPVARDSGTREIDQLQSSEQRLLTWTKLKSEKSILIDEGEYIEYSRLRY